MTNASPVIRNYGALDFPDLVRLQREAEAIDRTGRLVSSAAVSEWLAQPNHVPEKDVFVARKNGKLIGYSSTLPEMAIKRVVLTGLVHPRHRRTGTARRLLSLSLARAGECGAQMAQVSIPEGNAGARALLLSQGFGFVRRFLELEFSLENMPVPESGTCTIRGLRCGEEGRLAEAQNRCFRGTWGFNPNTAEEIVYRVRGVGCAPEDVLVATVEGKVAAYCWTRTRAGENGYLGPKRGQVHMLGVLPEFRGRGLGKKVLIAGLCHLMQKGVAVAELTVDSENEAARSLYQSVGFTTRSKTAWFQKTLPAE